MSDSQGLVFDLELLREPPASTTGAGAGQWIHYSIEEDQAGLLVAQQALPETIAEALVTANARPRVSDLEDGLVIVLRGVNCSPGADPEDMVSVRAWLHGERLVTNSPRRVFGIGDIRKQIEARRRDWTAGGVITAVADRLVERMRPVVEELEEVTDDLQESLLSDGPDGVQRPLSELRHKIVLLRRHMAPQRDALKQLARGQSSLLAESERGELHQIADRQQRYVEDLDALRERANVLQDEINHTVASTLNRNMYMLSIVAAVFLPLGLLTGLLGINVGGVPGTQSPYAFWIVCGILAVVSVAEVWFLRRRRML